MQLVLCNKNSHILHYSDNPTPLHSVQFIFINLVILQAFTQNIISVATAISRYTQQLLHNFLHLYNFEYTPASQKGHSSSATPALGRLAVFNRKGGVTGASSLADCSAFIYKRHSCRLLTWFVAFPEAFLAFAAQISGAVQEAVDLMAVLANEYAALFFSGGSADGTLLFCSVGA